MRVISSYPEFQDVLANIIRAGKIAEKSNCRKTKRGVVIVNEGEEVSTGYLWNAEYAENCNPCPRIDIHNNTQWGLCKAIHAERYAIEHTLEDKRHLLKGSKLYHIKIDEDRIEVPSRQPSCVDCAELILETGIAKVILFHKTGFTEYDADEFLELSRQYQRDNS